MVRSEAKVLRCCCCCCCCWLLLPSEFMHLLLQVMHLFELNLRLLPGSAVNLSQVARITGRLSRRISPLDSAHVLAGNEHYVTAQLVQ
jgi:hypothetical protein